MTSFERDLTHFLHHLWRWEWHCLNIKVQQQRKCRKQRLRDFFLTTYEISMQDQKSLRLVRQVGSHQEVSHSKINRKTPGWSKQRTATWIDQIPVLLNSGRTWFIYFFAQAQMPLCLWPIYISRCSQKIRTTNITKPNNTILLSYLSYHFVKQYYPLEVEFP